MRTQAQLLTRFLALQRRQAEARRAPPRVAAATAVGGPLAATSAAAVPGGVGGPSASASASAATSLAAADQRSAELTERARARAAALRDAQVQQQPLDSPTKDAGIPPSLPPPQERNQEQGHHQQGVGGDGWVPPPCPGASASVEGHHNRTEDVIRQAHPPGNQSSDPGPDPDPIRVTDLRPGRPPNANDDPDHPPGPSLAFVRQSEAGGHMRAACNDVHAGAPSSSYSLEEPSRPRQQQHGLLWEGDVGVDAEAGGLGSENEQEEEDCQEEDDYVQDSGDFICE